MCGMYGISLFEFKQCYRADRNFAVLTLLLDRCTVKHFARYRGLVVIMLYFFRIVAIFACLHFRVLLVEHFRFERTPCQPVPFSWVSITVSCPDVRVWIRTIRLPYHVPWTQLLRRILGTLKAHEHSDVRGPRALVLLLVKTVLCDLLSGVLQTSQPARNGQHVEISP